MIIKLAMKNIIRMPRKNILYFLIILCVTVISTASAYVYSACRGAEKALDESYIFVASAVPRSANSKFRLPYLELLLNGADIVAYNIAMSENNAVIPGGENTGSMPNSEKTEEPPIIWKDEPRCSVIAVEELYLARPFFSGDCVITGGTALTNAGYMGDVSEAVIPWWLAEEAGLKVGDTIIKRYNRETTIGNTSSYGYMFVEGTVVGIYTSKDMVKDAEKYPVYMPLAAAELEYGAFASSRLVPASQMMLDRADFILRGPDSFEAFVKNAERNGMEFTDVEIIFNNSSYDVLSEEIGSIKIIALIVLVSVLTSGVCVTVFMTAYFVNSRKKEREIMRALGMRKSGVSAMLISELALMLISASLCGFLTGRLTASFVCDRVNNKTLSEAALSVQIREAEAAERNTSALTLDRKIKISLSVDGGFAEGAPLPENRVKIPGPGELGISRHVYYDFGKFSEVNPVWVETTVVGLSDMSVVETSISYEEIKQLPGYNDYQIHVFVSEDRVDEDMRIYLRPFNRYALIAVRSNIYVFTDPAHSCTVGISGTYKPNKYASGNDILVCMDDYNRIFGDMSITERELCFKRIGDIVPLEDK